MLCIGVLLILFLVLVCLCRTCARGRSLVGAIEELIVDLQEQEFELAEPKATEASVLGYLAPFFVSYDFKMDFYQICMLC